MAFCFKRLVVLAVSSPVYGRVGVWRTQLAKARPRPRARPARTVPIRVGVAQNKVDVSAQAGALDWFRFIRLLRYRNVFMNAPPIFISAISIETRCSKHLSIIIISERYTTHCGLCAVEIPNLIRTFDSRCQQESTHQGRPPSQLHSPALGIRSAVDACTWPKSTTFYRQEGMRISFRSSQLEPVSVRTVGFCNFRTRVHARGAPKHFSPL